ncbi:MAG: glutamate--tRNA ligase, partial [Candidatus Paceibacteria bacterium]
MNKKKVITRIAPSPTGELHIGTARSALFNYLYAKQNGGEFIVRIEDTDKERSKKEFEKDILEGFEWLGLGSDEVFKQSERTSIYKKYIKQLLDDGVAYISKEKSKQEEGKEIEVVRLKNPGKKVEFIDLIRGEIEFDTTELGDFVIARNQDEPLYHLAVVVDDHEMGITHIIRGEDHISNTPRQILIQEALGFERSKYAHIPLILAPDRSKLSKRGDNATSISEYKEKGYISSALVNYMALLGWNPG